MKRSILVLAVLFLLAASLASTVGAAQPEGPVTITSAIDFTALPRVGRFEVTEGAELLGCSEGTYVGSWPGRGRRNSSIVRQDFFCEREPDEDGPDFVVKNNPNPTISGDEDLYGHWVFWKGTGDFAGLRGRGEVSVWWTFENGQVVRLESVYTGVVHYDP